MTPVLERRKYAVRSITAGLLCILCSTAFPPGGAATPESGCDADSIIAKCDSLLRAAVGDLADEDTIAVWVFFREEGRAAICRGRGAQYSNLVSQRAYRRIGLRAPRVDWVGYLPVERDRLEAVRAHALRIRRVSRYFNAVSADVAAREIGPISALPFVARLSRVAVFRRETPYETAERRAAIGSDGGGPLVGIYGGSLGQLDQIDVIPLLEMGYDGSGGASWGDPVLICILDTGFNRGHEALRGVNVTAEWDFVQNDSVTTDEDGDLPGQERHGTVVLGAIAGYHEGDLVGPAHGAAYLLAKTEIDGPTEIQSEEDNWVAAVEWADSAGADVISSSLGYIDWYTPSDIDGNTALCTRAADMAVSHGIVVVNSAGNLGTWGGITPPADGDSVIAVGAVYRDGSIVSFSSRGPTADGRIKPDLVAPGYLVRSVEYGTADGYADYSGTSMAAPLVAGLCAVLVEIHPSWGAVDLRERILETATRSADPDNTYGYGIPRGLSASGLEPTGIPDVAVFSVGYPNPFNETTSFDLFLPRLEPVTARVYDCRGLLVRTLAEGALLKWQWTLTWDGRNNSGSRVAGGVYFLVVESLSSRACAKVLYVP
jgi:serine protease AprX